MRNIYLSVVIPCYNEAGNIKNGKINQVINYLTKIGFPWELLIVDDGSTDDSRKMIQNIIKNKKNIKLIKNPHQGKAATVISGMLRAQGDYVLFTDLDQATPISELGNFIPLFDNNIDIIIGSRKDERKGAPFIRAIMGPGFTLLRKIILGIPEISDTQCGFKAFRKEAVAEIFKRLKLYKQQVKVKGSQVTAGFDVEMLYLAYKLGYQIKEIPVKWNYVETRRVNPVKDSLSAFIDLVRIRWNSFRGLYSN